MLKIINPLPKHIIEAIEGLRTVPEDQVSLIGSGEHGIVYKLFDDYAVKYFSDIAIRGNYLDYIYLEALQGIPYVPTLYGYSEKSFMIMEYVEGQNLYDFYLMHKQLPPNLRDLLSDAISLIFDRNIIPVEIKVEDHVIWNEKTKTLKLIDFGVCENCSHASLDFIKRMKKDWINSAMEGIDNFLKYVRNV